MAIELASKYLPYVDELFSTESRKSLVTNKDFDWTGAPYNKNIQYRHRLHE